MSILNSSRRCLWDSKADHLQEVRFGLGTSVQTLDPERIRLFLKVRAGRARSTPAVSVDTDRFRPYFSAFSAM